MSDIFFNPALARKVLFKFKGTRLSLQLMNNLDRMKVYQHKCFRKTSLDSAIIYIR